MCSSIARVIFVIGTSYFAEVSQSFFDYFITLSFVIANQDGTQIYSDSNSFGSFEGLKFLSCKFKKYIFN